MYWSAWVFSSAKAEANPSPAAITFSSRCSGGVALEGFLFQFLIFVFRGIEAKAGSVVLFFRDLFFFDHAATGTEL